jgi:hypothetical protein
MVLNQAALFLSITHKRVVVDVANVAKEWPKHKVVVANVVRDNAAKLVAKRVVS